MAIPIYIDTSEVIDEFGLTNSEAEEMIDYGIKELTAEFASNWAEEAKNSLQSSRREYINSIVVVDDGKMKGSVVLTGMVPNMIESGASAFDLKTGLLNSPKAKEKKDGSGKYITVPFRFATPDAVADSPLFANKLPTEIHGILKSKKVDIPMEGGKRTQGLSAMDIPEKYRVPEPKKSVTNVPESRVFKEYQRKTSIFQGVTRIVDSKTGQSRYVSFRRVSNLSDPDSWIHPGIQARGFAEKALEHTDIGGVIDRSIDNYLSKIGF